VSGPPRPAFEVGLGFALDPFQRRALDALDAGQSVLVAAPTGSGKTIVAEYAAALALASGTKAFYTTPLKALSNQKYGDLVRQHGPGKVGLLTGDNSVNGDAPIVVMTTEVLRNMIYAGSDTLDGLRYVVLDEVHYLQNRYRGAVWEEVIIHLPREVDLVCLSATVSNAEEFADWLRTVRGETTAIIEERRPVELTNLYAVGERGRDEIHLLPTFVPGPGRERRPERARSAEAGATREPEQRPNPEASRLDARGAGRVRGARGRPRSRLYPPRRVDLVELLAERSMLPAIVFIFSRAACDDAVKQCLAGGLRLTDADERRELRRIAEERVRALSEDDLAALGHDTWRAALEAGVAAHHAGMVPPMKEAVEEAFAAGLVKAVFATETLSLGINMPARSVVIEKLSKFTGEHHEFLTPGEYTQLTGRAGRRGIDDVGYAIVCWSPFVPFDQVAGLASRRTYALTSSFRPTYNMAANLVSRYPADVAHHLLNLSFAQYRADRDVVALERQLERNLELLERQRAAAHCERGDVAGYRELLAARDAARRAPHRGHQIAHAIEALRPGDVLAVRRGGGRAVVLRHEGSRGGSRVLALGASRDVFRLGPADFDRPPRPIGTVTLPRPFAPRSSAFRRDVAALLKGVRPAAEAPEPDREQDEREEELAEHPVGSCPELSVHLKASAAADRLDRDIARLERRVRSRSESLARQFDRVLRVLESWGYVEGWSLTPAGHLLARLYSESDLLLAETLRRGLLDGLDPPELAALASCFTYERRGPEGGALPPVRWPSSRVAKRSREIERLWRDLSANEDDAGLPETRAPDPGLVGALYAWADGDSLADVLDEDEDLTGGDFVRHVKQVIDLLHQVAEVAPTPETAAGARRAADACLRGVVAASSLLRP
jgi:ATP-dependent RNA helicase HelY